MGAKDGVQGKSVERSTTRRVDRDETDRPHLLVPGQDGLENRLRQRRQPPCDDIVAFNVLPWLDAVSRVGRGVGFEGCSLVRQGTVSLRLRVTFWFDGQVGCVCVAATGGLCCGVDDDFSRAVSFVGGLLLVVGRVGRGRSLRGVVVVVVPAVPCSCSHSQSRRVASQFPRVSAQVQQSGRAAGFGDSIGFHSLGGCLRWSSDGSAVPDSDPTRCHATLSTQTTIPSLLTTPNPDPSNQTDPYLILILHRN